MSTFPLLPQSSWEAYPLACRNLITALDTYAKEADAARVKLQAAAHEAAKHLPNTAYTDLLIDAGIPGMPVYGSNPIPEDRVICDAMNAMKARDAKIERATKPATGRAARPLPVRELA